LLAPTQISDFGWETLCDLPCSTNGERSDMLTVVTVESLVVVRQFICLGSNVSLYRNKLKNGFINTDKHKKMRKKFFFLYSHIPYFYSNLFFGIHTQALITRSIVEFRILKYLAWLLSGKRYFRLSHQVLSVALAFFA
jgi:hypothetical protein